MRDVLIGAKPLDNVNLLEELGDQTWYIALALRYLESNFGEIFDGNIAKLRKRFPDKFTEAAAINRDLDGERAVLEQAQICLLIGFRNHNPFPYGSTPAA